MTHANSTRPTICLVVGLALLAAPSFGSAKSICVSQTYAPAIEKLSSGLPGLVVVSFSTLQDLLAKAAACRAIVGLYLGGSVSMDDVLEATPDLEWVQSSSAGVENFLVSKRLVMNDVVLSNTRIIQGPEIADHAMGLLLNLTRDMKFYNEQMAKGWERAIRLPLIELRGKTALIVGLGGIGTQIAQRAKAFGMRVLAVDPKDFPLNNVVEKVVKPDDLDTMLPQADVVFSSVPLTAASRGMFGKDQFSAMKEGVYFINVSRGGVVDTDALVAALESGKVRAAGLDVTDPEPLPDGHPLWSMENVTITPHIATVSDQLESRRTALFEENVARFLSGRPLLNVVDKSKGY